MNPTMTRSINSRIDALEALAEPQRKRLSAIVEWPSDGSQAEQAAAQARIASLEAEGFAVTVSRNDADLERLTLEFL